MLLDNIVLILYAESHDEACYMFIAIVDVAKILPKITRTLRLRSVSLLHLDEFYYKRETRKRKTNHPTRVSVVEENSGERQHRDSSETRFNFAMGRRYQQI